MRFRVLWVGSTRRGCKVVSSSAAFCSAHLLSLLPLAKRLGTSRGGSGGYISWKLLLSRLARNLDMALCTVGKPYSHLTVCFPVLGDCFFQLEVVRYLPENGEWYSEPSWPGQFAHYMWPFSVLCPWPHLPPTANPGSYCIHK